MGEENFLFTILAVNFRKILEIIYFILKTKLAVENWLDKGGKNKKRSSVEKVTKLEITNSK